MADELPSVLEFSQNIADAKQPAPLPTRDYRASIRGAEVKLSKSGKRMIVSSFFVSPDQYPADYTDGNPDGTILSYYLVAEDTPQGRWRLRQFCEAIGAPMSARIEPSSWIGTDCMIKVEHEMYEGNPQARVASVQRV